MFQSQELKQFLSVWKIAHFTSSSHYAQANGRAELAIKSEKRIVSENAPENGKLNKTCSNIETPPFNI